jgi:hypothetical protein
MLTETVMSFKFGLHLIRNEFFVKQVIVFNFLGESTACAREAKSFWQRQFSLLGDS